MDMLSASFTTVSYVVIDNSWHLAIAWFGVKYLILS